ncbi:MAG: hypothetical protein DDT23_00822 [candidate division WS2 bacterium]|nr:hypothetical protein [Candidatus Lithacetigena glycinireducens]
MNAASGIDISLLSDKCRKLCRDHLTAFDALSAFVDKLEKTASEKDIVKRCDFLEDCIASALKARWLKLDAFLIDVSCPSSLCNKGGKFHNNDGSEKVRIGYKRWAFAVRIRNALILDKTKGGDNSVVLLGERLRNNGNVFASLQRLILLWRSFLYKNYDRKDIETKNNWRYLTGGASCDSLRQTVSLLSSPYNYDKKYEARETNTKRLLDICDVIENIDKDFEALGRFFAEALGERFTKIYFSKMAKSTIDSNNISLNR